MRLFVVLEFASASACKPMSDAFCRAKCTSLIPMPRNFLRKFLALFSLALLLLPSAPAAFVEPVQPHDPGTPTDIQILSLSMSPNAVSLGSPTEFSLTLQSYSNTVTNFETRIYIFNTAGALADSIAFRNSTIAGGEKQTLTGHFNTAGKPPGPYNAYAVVSYDSGSVRSGVLLFSIYDQNANSSYRPGLQNKTQPQAQPSVQASKPPPQQECGPACGEWEECSGGYRRQSCSYPAGCEGEPYVSMESCKQAGASQPFGGEGLLPIFIWLGAPLFLLAIIAGAYFALRKKFGQEKRLGRR